MPADDLGWTAAAFAPTADPAWVLHETGYDPTREAGIEARFAIGNGFLGVRGSRSVSRGPTWTSYQHNLSWASWPRTYVAGLFDTPNTEPPVPALVPAPDWLRVRIWVDGELALIRSGTLLAHDRWLDMRRGLLLTEWKQRLPGGHELHLRTLRFVSQADRALGGQMLQVAIEGPPTTVQLEASFEALGSALEPVHVAPELAMWRTAQSGRSLAIAGTAELHVDGIELAPQRPNGLDRRWTWTSRARQSATMFRTVAFVRGETQDDEASVSAYAALDQARQIGWRRVLGEHERAWATRWSACDVEIAGDEDAQRALRFAVYHLISAASPEDPKVSIGARALTGDAYLGHIFWDTEVYLLPFYTLTWPEAARALLLYRYHTLPGARAKAARMGFRGAFYAWESADDGEETTPEKIIDPTGRVIEVLCGKQEWHIAADVAYAVWQYWQATGDDDFMLRAGAEIVLEVARFWASCAVLEADGQYHIRGVIGPDEYHEHIDDNAYTNMLARWTLKRAQVLFGPVGPSWGGRRERLAERLRLDEAELAHWGDVAERLVVRFDPQTRVYEQFEGFFRLEDIDLTQYEGRTVPMDVVLGRERTQASQVIKQADVVALLALLPDVFERDVTEANFRFYAQRCGHGSSLSHGLHGIVAARLGQIEAALGHFRKTAEIDLGPTAAPSAGGIRIAAQGGLWQIAIFGFAGLAVEAEGLRLTPALPPAWRSMAFRAGWRGRCVHLCIENDPPTVTATLEKGEAMCVCVGDTRRSLREAGAVERFEWHRTAEATSGGATSVAAS